jgi:hypothetical protein
MLPPPTPFYQANSIMQSSTVPQAGPSRKANSTSTIVQITNDESANTAPPKRTGRSYIKVS